jgi:hypothetical protein
VEKELKQKGMDIKTTAAITSLSEVVINNLSQSRRIK